MGERTFICEFCGAVNRTADSRKRFCDKKCADRNRNRTAVPGRIPTHGNIITDLKGFNKLEPEAKRRILLGEEQFTIAMFDIEATNLKPNVGRILCASIKPLNAPAYTLSGLDRKYKRPDVYDDGALACAIRDELEKFDIIVGWNSKMFDVKYINSRVLRTGERVKRAQYHIDGMWSWRTKVSAWSKLDSAQKYMLPNANKNKTSVIWEQWMRAIGWDPKLSREAFAGIEHHCELDVEVLEDVYTSLVKADVIRNVRKDGGIL